MPLRDSKRFVSTLSNVKLHARYFTINFIEPYTYFMQPYAEFLQQLNEIDINMPIL